MLGHDPPANQCLDTINTSRSRRGQEDEGCGQEEECGDEGNVGEEGYSQCDKEENGGRDTRCGGFEGCGSIRGEGSVEEGCGGLGGERSGNMEVEVCGKEDPIDKRNGGPVAGECENTSNGTAVGVVIAEETEEGTESEIAMET